MSRLPEVLPTVIKAMAFIKIISKDTGFGMGEKKEKKKVAFNDGRRDDVWLRGMWSVAWGGDSSGIKSR